MSTPPMCLEDALLFILDCLHEHRSCHGGVEICTSCGAVRFVTRDHRGDVLSVDGEWEYPTRLEEVARSFALRTKARDVVERERAAKIARAKKQKGEELVDVVELGTGKSKRRSHD